MIDVLRDVSRWVHIVVGFAGLLAFWFPVLSRKGGRLHRQAGKVFVACGYVVAGSASISCALVAWQAFVGGGGLADLGFVIFLAYLALATFASIRHAVWVVANRRSPPRRAMLFHRGLARAAVGSSVVIVAYALIFYSSLTILLIALSPIGWGVGTGILQYTARPPRFARAWFYEHMSATLTAGIAFHTAFAVFGAGRLFALEPTGAWGFVPWVLPSAIGIPAGYLWDRHYRRKLGDPTPRTLEDREWSVG